MSKVLVMVLERVEVEFDLGWEEELGERKYLMGGWWVRDLEFDLITLVDRYREYYGDPVNVILRFTDWSGNVHNLQLGLFALDSAG